VAANVRLCDIKALTAKEKWTYAVGNVPFAVKDAAFVNFVVFFYTQVHGLSGTLAGLAMFIALSWDAISDPIVGSWSDSFRSRWGRRHPLMLAGGLPTALLFLALFAPPSTLNSAGVFAWLLGVSILLRTCLTIYFIPYSAMGAELSTDYDERTVIAKARITMAWIAGMALPACAFLFFFQTVDGVDGRLVSSNYWHFGVLAAIIAGATALICVIGTRTTIPRLPSWGADKTFSWRDPLLDIKSVLQNRNFRLFVGANLAFGMSAGVYNTLALYLGTYFWEFSSDQLASMVIPTAIATAIAFTSLSHLGRRFDKPYLLAAFCMVLALNSFWFVGSRLFGWLPANGDPAIYMMLLLNTAIGVFVIVGVQVVGASLAADVLDEQELATGQRQEGVVFAASAFVQKATTGAGSLIAGIVIDLSGITPGAAPGSVAQPVLQTLGGFTVAMTAGLAFIAFLFMWQINLTRAQHARVRKALISKEGAG